MGAYKVQAYPRGVRATGRDEYQSVPSPEKPFKTRDLELSLFRGISPKLFAALRGIHPSLSTPVLPRFKQKLSRNKDKRQIRTRTNWRCPEYG